MAHKPRKIFCRSILAFAISSSFLSVHAAQCNDPTFNSGSGTVPISGGDFCSTDQAILSDITMGDLSLTNPLTLSTIAISRDVNSLMLQNSADINLGIPNDNNNPHQIKIFSSSSNSTGVASHRVSAAYVQNPLTLLTLNDSFISVSSGYAKNATSGNAFGLIADNSGVIALSNSRVDVIAAKDDLGSSGGVATGSYANYSNSRISLVGQNIFNITGGKDTGVSNAIGAEGLSVTNGGSIEASLPRSNTEINMQGASDGRNNQIGVHASGVDPINVHTESNINLGNIIISTDGLNSDGIKVDANGQVALRNYTKEKITTNGADSVGILIDRGSDNAAWDASNVRAYQTIVGERVDVSTLQDNSIAFAILNNNALKSLDEINGFDLSTAGKSSDIIKLSSDATAGINHTLAISDSNLSAQKGIGIEAHNNVAGTQNVSMYNSNLVMNTPSSLAAVNNGDDNSVFVLDLLDSHVTGNIQGSLLAKKMELTMEGASVFSGAALGADLIEINNQNSVWNVSQNSIIADKLYSGGTINLLKGNTIDTKELVLASDSSMNQASNLNIILGGSTSPAINVTDKATLSGNLNVEGFASNFNGSGSPIKDSQLSQLDYTLIHTANGISGDFSSKNIPVSNDLDYLLQFDSVSANQQDYNLGFLSAWSNGGQNLATGNFTINAGTAFEEDQILANQSVPSAGFSSGWNGKDLTKLGDGLLVLSAVNTYSGKTTLVAGTLKTGITNAFAKSSDVIVNGGELDLNGFAQKANRLAGRGGNIKLDGAALNVNNASVGADDSSFAGGIIGNGNLVKTGAGSLTLSGKTDWIGNTEIDNGSLILDGKSGGGQLVGTVNGQQGGKLVLQNNASFTGSIDPVDVTIVSGGVWNVTSASDTINLSNAGKINFVNSLAGNSINVTGNYLGNNGQIVFNVALAGDNSLHDSLIVNGSSAGKTKVFVKNAGGFGAKTVNGIELIHVNSASNGDFVLANRLVAGAYNYQLYQGVPSGNDGNWYLRSNYRPESGSYLANQISAESMFMHTLHERLGESLYSADVANSANVNGSVWARVYAYQQDSKAANSKLNLSSNTSIIQVGSDLIHLQDSSSVSQLGVMFSAGQSNSKSDNVANSTENSYGKLNGYAIGLYGTWYAQRSATNGGLYIDGSWQYARYDASVKGDQLYQQDYNSHDTSVSLESGYAFALNINPDNQWFIEPQAQVIYNHYGQDKIHETNGSDIGAANRDFWTSRLGSRVYARTILSDGMKLKPFAEFNWLHDTKQAAVVMGMGSNVTTVYSDLPKDRAEIKLGLESELSKNVNLWFNAGYQTGSHGYKQVQGNIGMKYIW